MKGLELSREYYEAFGAPLIRNIFPEHVDKIAVGLVGEGSECFGYDDEISQDHDFGPGFCIWVTAKTAKEIGEGLEILYDKIPKEFKGFVRHETPEAQGRLGVFSIGKFYKRYTNCLGAPGSNKEWLNAPEEFLATASNGAVFTDPEGIFTEMREKILAFYPEDVLRKKLAARAAVMSQAGQYNYPRCMNRRDTGAAFLALNEFIKAALSAIYLLNKRYMPFYKWAFRGAEELTLCKTSVEALKRLADVSRVVEPQEAQVLIEGICSEVARELNRQGYSRCTDPFLQAHCPDIMSGIKDPEIRALHVMADC